MCLPLVLKGGLNNETAAHYSSAEFEKKKVRFAESMQNFVDKICIIIIHFMLCHFIAHILKFSGSLPKNFSSKTSTILNFVCVIIYSTNIYKNFLQNILFFLV